MRASGSDVAEVSAKVATPFSIPAPITLYAYFQEKRNAFPIWVDVQVPPDATPGDCTASIEYLVQADAIRRRIDWVRLYDVG
ncbi:MAG TPA: hypothetical protein VH054_30105 [Polyangiaceae bacterium]|nr:hypothetical protein [Polyangiaceae bacterium]